MGKANNSWDQVGGRQWKLYTDLMSAAPGGFASLGTTLLFSHVLYKYLGHITALDIQQEDLLSKMQRFFFHIASQHLETVCGIFLRQLPLLQLNGSNHKL